MRSGFWKGRKVLLTGHTGFKGTWMSMLLETFDAEVTGIALKPDTDPALWDMVSGHFQGTSHFADIRTVDGLKTLVQIANPEVVIHMAAQAQVRQGFRDPIETFSTNVIGTMNLLDALQNQSNLKAVLVVTSDKVYWNDNSGKEFCESDPLGGSDPYSASKAASEHIVRSYAESFFKHRSIPVATARAGNVIGGGDWSSDRLVPDVYRAIVTRKPLVLRYPDAYRPWQHVLDCISGYLLFAEFLSNRSDNNIPALNFGPGVSDYYPTVAEIADSISRVMGAEMAWVADENVDIEEKQMLALNTELAHKVLGWRPMLDMSSTVNLTAEWYAAFSRGEDAFSLMQSQIDHFLFESH